MTDNEIIKALECCSKEECLKQDCPIFNTKYCEEPSLFFREILDLINRLQAEKEALINGQETLQKYIADLRRELEVLSLKVFGQKNALFGQQVYAAKLQKELTTAKSEAIKEFAERLKKEFLQHQREYRKVLNSDGACAMIIAKKSIDNLVKEMTEASQ